MAGTIAKKKHLKRKNGSGKVAKKVTTKEKKEIKRRFNHRLGCSQRRTASEFNIAQSYLNKILKESSGVKYYKKLKKPLMTDEQKKLLRRISRTGRDEKEINAIYPKKHRRRRGVDTVKTSVLCRMNVVGQAPLAVCGGGDRCAAT
jgi:transposase